MKQLNLHRYRLAAIIGAVALAALLGACRAEQNDPADVSDRVPPTETAAPTQLVDPSPPPTATPSPTPEPVHITLTPEHYDFALTILHTGQVYGEIDPCG